MFVNNIFITCINITFGISQSARRGQISWLTECLGRLLSEVDTIAAEVALQKNSIQSLDEGMTTHRDEIENINSHVARLFKEDRFETVANGPKQNVFWCVCHGFPVPSGLPR